MPEPIYCEMAENRCRNVTNGTQCQPFRSTDELILTLLKAASHRYSPAAPSPLNPRSSSDSKPRKHAARSKRPRPVRKGSSETPTEKLLRRKAAIAYERTTKTKTSPSRKDESAVILTRLCDPPKKGPSVTIAAKAPLPTEPKGAGPLVVSLWEARHDLLTDVERQSAIRQSDSRQWAASRQRLELPLMLVLLSACLTFLTVVGLDSLTGHYIAG